MQPLTIISGLLEVLYWSVVCCRDPHRVSLLKPWQWIVFFNPILFPFSTILWHVHALRTSSDYNSHFALFLVLNSLQSFTESAAIVILQLVIIITTWEDPAASEVVVTAISTIGQSDVSHNDIANYVQAKQPTLFTISMLYEHFKSDAIITET